MGKSLAMSSIWHSKLKTSSKNKDLASKKDVKSTKQENFTASLIQNHLVNRTEPPWEQEFSSMSSCRSDLETNPALHKANIEDEDEDLPALLRNLHLVEFDIVQEEDSDFSEDEQVANPVSVLPKKRRNNNSSFSASIPSEIKGIVADSIPLVKYSHDPYRDFRYSMLEMIREKELRNWCDLEELLFCYLSLNSPDHHEIIKRSFSDVWHELSSR